MNKIEKEFKALSKEVKEFNKKYEDVLEDKFILFKNFESMYENKYEFLSELNINEILNVSKFHFQLQKDDADTFVVLLIEEDRTIPLYQNNIDLDIIDIIEYMQEVNKRFLKYIIKYKKRVEKLNKLR
jgi:hypothetical protein